MSGRQMTQMTTEEVWTAFSAPLRGYIRRQVRNESAVDDLLQEVFVRVHTHGANIRAQESLRGWLYEITRNVVTDHFRRQRPGQFVPFPIDAEERYAAPEPDTVASSLQALSPCVRAMAEALPEPYREALLLTEFAGLSQRALAGRLGLTFSGAKSRVQRAREKLRALLLACCHLEFDHAGRVMGYQPNCACCAEADLGEDACAHGGATDESCQCPGAAALAH